MREIPNKIYSGKWGKCHCQGACIDTKREYVYYSFTTKLIKTDLDGNIIGSVENIVGHLGCMDFCDKDGKVYASLEYKNDSVGKGILRNLGISDESVEDGFYVAIFDVDKIDRLNMHAEKDGIMRAVYLKTVLDDYKGSSIVGEKTYEHAYGCSGIDGLTISPDFSKKSGKRYLNVCYGVYSDVDRPDNDYQIILQYDMDKFWETAKPLNQSAMHRIGPKKPRNRFFFYTGNTTYGIQNLEYDEFTGDYFVFVYGGKKPNFPNYELFVIDGSKKPKKQKLIGYDNEKGKVLSMKKSGKVVNGVSGIYFPYGSMGAYSIGDGNFMLVEPLIEEEGNLSVNFVKYNLDTSGEEYKFDRIEKE